MKFVIALIFLLSSSALASAQNFVGQAVVSDGDNIEIHGLSIRIWGVDALESKQLCWDAQSKVHQCGRIAANALAQIIGRSVVSCEQVATDHYGRPVAKCEVRGRDIGEWLVRSGFAIDYVKYSRGAYADAQDAARANNAGLWQMEWQHPANYRACMKRRGGKIAICSQQ